MGQAKMKGTGTSKLNIACQCYGCRMISSIMPQH